jgi:hypothetical protein
MESAYLPSRRTGRFVTRSFTLPKPLRVRLSRVKASDPLRTE